MFRVNRDLPYTVRVNQKFTAYSTVDFCLFILQVVVAAATV